MDVSPFAFLTALLWSSLFIVLFHLCRKNNMFITKVGVLVLFFLIAVSTSRMLFTIELPFTIIIRSPHFLTKVQNLLSMEFVLDLAIVHFLIGIWVVVALLLLCEYIMLIRERAKAVKLVYYQVDVESIELLEQIASSTRCKKVPDVIRCGEIASPFIAGYSKPMIYLPNYDYSEQDLCNVLLHEWVHYLHHDAWIKVLVQLFCIAFWWNPLVYTLQVDVTQILEMNCDRTSAKILTKNHREVRSYTDTIITMVRQQKADKKKVCANLLLSRMFYSENRGEEDLKQRLRILLRSQKTKVDKKLVVLLVTTVLSLFAFSFAFVIQPENPTPVVEGVVDTSIMYLEPEASGGYNLYINGIYKDYITSEKAETFIESGVVVKDGSDKT